MNTEVYRRLIEEYEYTYLDIEYGPQERVSSQTLENALKALEYIDIHPDSFMPYEGGIDIFWGGYGTGSLLLHVYKDEMYFSGLHKGTHDIYGSTFEDLDRLREWLTK